MDAEAFEKTRKVLTSETFLALPQFDKLFRLETDASHGVVKNSWRSFWQRSISSNICTSGKIYGTHGSPTIEINVSHRKPD